MLLLRRHVAKEIQKNLAKEIQNTGEQEIQKNLQKKSKEVLQKKSWFLVCGGRTSSPYPITVGCPPPPYSRPPPRQYEYIVQHIKRSTKPQVH